MNVETQKIELEVPTQEGYRIQVIGLENNRMVIIVN